MHTPSPWLFVNTCHPIVPALRMITLALPIALAVPAPDAPAALARESATAPSVALSSRTSGWALDPRMAEFPGQLTGCPIGQHTAAESECLAAVQEAAQGLPVRGLKVTNAGAEGVVPGGCSYSRRTKRAIFNRNPAGRGSSWYELVCMEEEAQPSNAKSHALTTPVDSSNAHCACGELRQASLAPDMFELLQHDLFDGAWFLVFSNSSKYGNDDGLQGTCVPPEEELSVPAEEFETEPPAHIEGKLKLVGSFMRVQKMQRCMELVNEEEKRRGAAFATVTFSRPDILMCSKIAAPSPGSLLAGQMVTWGEDWFGEDGREMAVPRDIVHDYIFTLDRQTAAQLVEDLLDDIMSGPQQPDWVDSLSAACPAHRALADQGDATLECLLARRLRINGWQARTERTDFTLVRAGYSHCETRCGSDACQASAGAYVASDACMEDALYQFYEQREPETFEALRAERRGTRPGPGNGSTSASNYLLGSTGPLPQHEARPISGGSTSSVVIPS